MKERFVKRIITMAPTMAGGYMIIDGLHNLATSFLAKRELNGERIIEAGVGVIAFSVMEVIRERRTRRLVNEALEVQIPITSKKQ